MFDKETLEARYHQVHSHTVIHVVIRDCRTVSQFLNKIFHLEDCIEETKIYLILSEFLLMKYRNMWDLVMGGRFLDHMLSGFDFLVLDLIGQLCVFSLHNAT